MSSLSDGDRHLHHSDNSHRWAAPDGTDPKAWKALVQAHVDLHTATMGGPPVRPGVPRSCGLPDDHRAG